MDTVILLSILKHGVLLEEERGDGYILVICIIAFIYVLRKHGRLPLLKFDFKIQSIVSFFRDLLLHTLVVFAYLLRLSFILSLT